MRFKNLLLLLIVSISINGCISQKFVKSDNTEYTTHEDNSNEDLITNIDFKKLDKEEQRIYIENALNDFYNEWKGVKYKFGGDTKKGIDCSAFTQKVFKEKFQLDIPRTTRTQVKLGKTIKKDNLKLGDLVFFKTGKVDRHVGIYIGNGEFMHASIKGVKVTKLNKPFYKKAYWVSKRVIF